MISPVEHWLRIIGILLGVMVAVLVLWILHLIQGILLPFCMALFFVYLAEPLQVILVRWKFPIALRVGVILLVASLFLYLLGLLIYSSSQGLVEKLPHYEERFKMIIENGFTEAHLPEEMVIQLREKLNWRVNLKSENVTMLLGQTFGSFFGFLTNSFMVILYMVYLLFEREHVSHRITRSFPEKKARHLLKIVHHINHQIVGYLGIKTAMSLVTGVLVTLILVFFGVDFAVFWGILACVLNFVPAIGALAATVPPIIVAFLQFDTFTPPLIITGFLCSVQLVLGNVVEPKVMGKGLGLSPLVVILALIFWGWLWGPAGMILSVPIVSAMKIIFDNIELLRPISRFLEEGKA